MAKRRHNKDLPAKVTPQEFGGGRKRGYYTTDEVQKVYCSRAGCGRLGYATWSGCADGRAQRPLCPECDVDLNRKVLEWWGDPDIEAKMAAYIADVEKEIGDKLIPVDSRERDVVLTP